MPFFARTLSFAVFALIAACSKSDGAKSASAVSEPSPVAQDATPVEPVDPKTLVALFPKTLGEWQLGGVFGDEHALGARRITSAAAYYERNAPGKEKKQRIALVLIDGAKIADAYASFETAWNTKLSNASIAYSHVRIADEPGVELVSHNPPTVQLHLLVEQRFLVQFGPDAQLNLDPKLFDLDGPNLSPPNLSPEEWTQLLQSFPLDQVKALKG